MTASGRPRHPKKELEDLLKIAESRNWTITRNQGYFRAWCPCGEHHESVVLSPSGANYKRNKLHKMSKCPMWGGGV